MRSRRHQSDSVQAQPAKALLIGGKTASTKRLLNTASTIFPMPVHHDRHRTTLTSRQPRHSRHSSKSGTGDAHSGGTRQCPDAPSVIPRDPCCGIRLFQSHDLRHHQRDKGGHQPERGNSANRHSRRPTRLVGCGALPGRTSTPRGPLPLFLVGGFELLPLAAS
jgi:hypothetical protein